MLPLALGFFGLYPAIRLVKPPDIPKQACESKDNCPVEPDPVADDRLAFFRSPVEEGSREKALKRIHVSTNSLTTV